MALLNLGILAHVDAGKTTLTERLLYAAGAIPEIGSVDAGTTRTDSLALERRRGITIKSAVVSFAVGDVIVNLIDTPGHPDFIAEVERVLGVLDGAVLVISAVEGPQPQSRILMRALQRLRVPTLLFVNKIDRRGADTKSVLGAVTRRLTPAVVAMGSVTRPGSRAAGFVPGDAREPRFVAALTEALADADESLLADYVAGAPVPYGRLRRALAAQTAAVRLHPVFLGSALTGAGVGPLTAGIAELLPAAREDTSAPVSGTVFKIDRDDAGDRVAYVRMFAGRVRTRDRVRVGATGEGKVTAIEMLGAGEGARAESVSAGQIARLHGLGRVRIGDALGVPPPSVRPSFAPPTLEAVVAPHDPGDRRALADALARLAEQDPLIDVRRDERGGELSVSLYGEVQQEVIGATLAEEYGIEVDFRDTTTICVERPAGTGDAAELLHAATNPYAATVGLRVEPAPPGAGLEFRLDVDARDVPVHIYKTVGGFRDMMAGYVRGGLRRGPRGWRVTDCVVTMTACAYFASDGRPVGATTPRTTAADFRRLTPLVLARALAQAGTVECEPVLDVHVETPADAVGAVLAAIARLGGVAGAAVRRDDLCTITGRLPAASTGELRRRLPQLTGGEGVLESAFAGYSARAAR